VFVDEIDAGGRREILAKFAAFGREQTNILECTANMVLGIPSDFSGSFVVAHANELGMSQQGIAGPLPRTILPRRSSASPHRKPDMSSAVMRWRQADGRETCARPKMGQRVAPVPVAT
jgi:hypothetical protein